MNRRSLLTISHLASLDITIKAAMRDVCRESCRSREEIVDAMNELASASGVRLTGGNAKQLLLPTFEKWLSPTATDHVPLMRALVIFCEVTGSTRPLEAAVEPLGARVIDAEQASVLEVAEIEREIKLLRKRKKMLEGCK